MKDNFSSQADTYAKFRPSYPPALFEHILRFVKSCNAAWDCGTGNGQTAKVLSNYFTKVFATDISQKQIEHAFKKENIHYELAPAEKTNLANASINLVTVSQALHWFNFDEFYSEVKRVAAKDAVIAVWTYSLLQIEYKIDQLISSYHNETLGKYWDEERKFVDDGYSSIPFPFKQIPGTGFYIECNWNVNELEGYLNTWSALQKFIHANQNSPVTALMKDIKQHWQENEVKKIIFPIHLKMGFVHEADLQYF